MYQRFPYRLVLLSIAFLAAQIALMAAKYSPPPMTGYFYIKSTAHKKSWGGFLNQKSPQNDLRPGANVFVQRMKQGQTEDKNRLFRFVSAGQGFYYIQSGNGGYLTIQGGKNKKGASIQINDGQKDTAQKFRFEYKGQGKWKIHTRFGKIVNLDNAYAANNVNVQIWWNHTIPSTLWYFEKARTHARYTPSGLTGKSKNDSSKSGQGFYTLDSGEEFVYGKIGLDDKGQKKYTFAIVRKSNPGKKVYQRPFDPYTSRPISSGRPMRPQSRIKSYDKYDYFVIFNGKKFGPWDRIMDMKANNPDIDDWVSRHGERITLSAVRGQKRYPIIASRQGAPFWTIGQAPISDAKAGKYIYAMEWSRDNFNIVGPRGFLKKGLKDVKTISFASKGNDWLYVAAPKSKRKNYLYLNGEKKAGPHYLFRVAGFIPGTEQWYYSAFDRAAGSGYKQNVVIDGKNISLPGTGSVTLKTDARKLVFTYTQRTGSSAKYAKKKITIYEYTVKNRRLTQHGPYRRLASIHHNGNFFYYTTYDKTGQSLLIAEGGQVKSRISPPEKGSSVAARISPSGDAWVWYKKNDSIKILKNGKVWKGIDTPCKRLAHIQFSPTDGKPQMVLNIDKSVASKEHILVHGSAAYKVTGGMGKISADTVFPASSNDVYWIRRYILSDRSYKWQLYKNKQALTKPMRTVTALSASQDGKRYAALMSETGSVFQYYPLNKVMDQKLRLIVDGKIKKGRYGAPVWSKVKNKFLVIEARSGALQISEL